MQDILFKFGGHKLAAGVTIEKKNLEVLRQRLNEQAQMTEQDLIPKLMIDVPMPLRYVNMNLIRQLDSLEPFGTGNPRPLFAEAGLQLLGMDVFGKRNNAIKLRVKDSRGGTFILLNFDPEGVIGDIKKWFTDEVCDKILRGIDTGVKIDVAYQPAINVFNGQSSIQFMLRNIRPNGGDNNG